MSFEKCINNALAAGKIKQSQRDDLLAAFQKDAATFGDDVAAKRVSDKAAYLAADKYRKAQRQAKVEADLLERMDNGLALHDLVLAFHGAGGKTLNGVHESVHGELRGLMNDVLRKFSPNLVGKRRNKALLSEVLQESLGVDSKNKAAKELWAAYSQTVERANKLHYDAGGDFRGKPRGISVRPSQLEIAKVTKDEYRAFVKQHTKKADFVDEMGRPLSDADIDETIDAHYEYHKSGGWSDAELRPQPKPKISGSRGIGHELPFNNADDWLAYNEKFGGEDPWRSMVAHIDNMAHEIAHMDVLGPTPNATWELLKRKRLKDANESNLEGKEFARNKRKADADVVNADRTRDVWTGKTMKPSDKMLARGLSTTREYISATRLGSAVIPSITDFNSNRVAAGMMGLSKLGPMKNFARLVASPEFRRAATESGLILENAIDAGFAAQRHSMEDFHREFTSRLADFVFRSTLLSGATQMQRDAFGMTVMNGFAELAGKSFDDLPRMTQADLADYGISPELWDNIRKAELYEVNGFKMLRPKEIEAVAGRDAALLFMEMLVGRRAKAVPTSSVRVKSATIGRAEPGSTGGEILRSVMQFKGHPFMVLMLQVGEAVKLATKGRKADALGYFTGLVLGNTLLGMAAMQVKEIQKGRDPLDMTKLETWNAALLQGGGLGILGDFLFQDTNRFGGSLAETLAGPTVSLGADVINLTAGNVRQLIRGEETNFAAEAADFVLDNNPMSSYLWTRLLYEREIADRFMLMLDPDAAQKLNRKAKNAERDKSGYWWRPGASIIDGDSVNAPDLGEALGG